MAPPSYSSCGTNRKRRIIPTVRFGQTTKLEPVVSGSLAEQSACAFVSSFVCPFGKNKSELELHDERKKRIACILLRGFGRGRLSNGVRRGGAAAPSNVLQALLLWRVLLRSETRQWHNGATPTERVKDELGITLSSTPNHDLGRDPIASVDSKSAQVLAASS